MTQRRDHDRQSVVTALHNVSQSLPPGMLIVGYEERQQCEFCDLSVEAYHVYFVSPIRHNNRDKHYLWLCDVCVDLVTEYEYEYQALRSIE